MFVSFEYDITKDARSWVRWVFYGNPHLSRQGKSKYKHPLLIELSGVSDEDQAQKVAEKYLSNCEDERAPLLARFFSQIEPRWRKIEKRVFDNLQGISGNPIYAKEFTGYLVSSGNCSYFPPGKWFMVNLKKENSMMDVVHELLHLQVSNYYQDFCLQLGLSVQQYYSLNEILTEILNIEMAEIVNEVDAGYEKHKELRDWVRMSWEGRESFEDFLRDLILKIKKAEYL